MASSAMKEGGREGGREGGKNVPVKAHGEDAGM